MMPPKKEDEGSVSIHDTKKVLKLAKMHGYISYNTSGTHTPLTLKNNIDQKYLCSKCDPIWVRVGDHYECNRKCGKEEFKKKRVDNNKIC